MSAHGAVMRKDFGTRLIQALALATVFGVLWLATRVSPELGGKLGVIAAIGYLLLAGTLFSELLEIVGLPHLSGYILAGVLGGPHILHLIDHQTVEQLSPVNTLAISLISLQGGAVLHMEAIRRAARSLIVAQTLQSVLVLVSMSALFIALARFIPFARDMSLGPLLGAALLWGVLAVTRSPAALLGVLSQTRAKGPVAEFSLAFIMTSNVVVVVLLACVMMVARPLIMQAGEVSMRDILVLGRAIVGSVAVGTTLGLILAIYLRIVGRHLLLVLLAIGFAVTDFLAYVDIDPLLAFLIAGFVIQNLTSQGPKLLTAIERTSTVVFVVFFATAGAHLDVPLLQRMWPIALALCAGRAVATWMTARLSSRIARDEPAVATWAWTSLVAQAGLALGVAVVIARTFPTIGDAFRNLVVATVAVNEIVGPILFKFALDRSGESKPDEEMRPSLPG